MGIPGEVKSFEDLEDLEETNVSENEAEAEASV